MTIIGKKDLQHPANFKPYTLVELVNIGMHIPGQLERADMVALIRELAGRLDIMYHQNLMLKDSFQKQ